MKHAVERYDPYGVPEYAGIRVDGAFVFNDTIPDEDLRLQVSRAQAVLDFRAAERDPSATWRPVIVASCEAVDEFDDAHPRCPGELHFTWGMVQAACGTCGAWSGISVSDWTRVETERQPPQRWDPPPLDVVHATPEHRGAPTTCCGRTLEDLVRFNVTISAVPENVTCPGPNG